MKSSVIYVYIMFRKGVFWTIGEHLNNVYYPIIYYQSIEVYKAEKNDMGRFLWNNGVS